MAKTDPELATRPAHFIAAASQEPFKASWVRLDERLTAPLLKALGQARNSHREAMADAGLADPPRLAEWRQRLVGYRRDVESDVLDPFIQVAEHKEPAAAIAASSLRSTRKQPRPVRHFPNRSAFHGDRRR